MDSEKASTNRTGRFLRVLCGLVGPWILFSGCTSLLRTAAPVPWGGGSAPLHAIRYVNQPVRHLAISPSGKYIVAAFDAMESDVQAVAVPGTGWGLGMPREGRDARVIVWRQGALGPREMLRVRLESDSLGCVAFTADESGLRLPNGSSLITYNLATGEPIRNVVLDGMIGLAPNAPYAVRQRDARPMYDVVHVETGRVVCALDDGATRAADTHDAFRFSSDGRFVARIEQSTAAPPLLTIWNIETGERIAVRRVQGLRSDTVEFSPDGGLVAVFDTRGILVLRTVDGVETMRFAGDSAMAFSSDGRFLAAASQTLDTRRPEHEINIWEMATGHRVAQWKITDPIHAVAFSPDASLAFTGHQSGRIRAWQVPGVPRQREARLIVLPRLPFPKSD